MNGRRTALVCLGLLLGVLAARCAEEAPSPEGVARQAWAISEVVLDRHIDPPSRQEMLLYGTRGVLRTVGATMPDDLSRRVSRVTTEAEYAALLKELWPREVAARADVKEALVRGLLWPVPGQAHLYTPKQYKAHEQIANNRYEGTGIQVRMNPDEKLVEVMAAFPNGPAKRAGMKARDLIEAVDDVDCHGKSLADVVALIQGSAGLPVTLVVRQAGTKDKRTLKMVRDVVPFETVTGFRRTGETSWQYRIDPKEPIAYLRMRRLTSSAVAELRKIERKLQEDRCQALVLDLRYCQDGDVHQASLFADALLDGGLMWRLADRGGRVRDAQADRDCLFRGWPLVVLVNEFTRGSGADLVAAALQDAGRARLVGVPTRGDGLVKTFHELPHGLGMLHLATSAVVRAPAKGPRPGQHEPIPREEARLWRVTPDVVVAVEREKAQTVEDWHNAQEIADRPTDEKLGEPPADPPLDRARELLRKALAPAGAGTGTGVK